MGNGVLITRQTAESDPQPLGQKDEQTTIPVTANPTEPGILSYCHCSRRFDQGLALLLVNPSTSHVSITVQFTASGGVQWDAIIYGLAAGPNNTDIQLNGEVLQVTKSSTVGGTDSWLMPGLEGKNVSRHAGTVHKVTLKSQSYLFVEYPEAMFPACAREK